MTEKKVTRHPVKGGTPEIDLNCKKIDFQSETGLPDISLLEKKILKYIIGQNTQVRQIITAIYRSIIFKSIKSNALIIGTSGSGKTETIKQIAKKLKIPYTIEDATKYTKEGYYGSDVSEMIFNLIENCDGDIEKAQKGILIIDEIDKKVNRDGSEDISGVDVLKSLLKIIEGSTIMVENDDVFDTSNLIVIFLGAFDGLNEIRKKRLNHNQLGFSLIDSDSSDSSTAKYIKKDLINYGMPEEFLGRIDTIIEMNTLTENDLIEILKKSKLSIFRKYQKELKSLGVTLRYPRKLFNTIAKKSLSSDTGARELSNTVNQMFENIIFDIFANLGKYTECRLYLDTVTNNTHYTLS